MKSKRAAVLITAGVLCLAGALGLTVKNIFDEERAAESYAAHAARSGSRGKEMYGELSRKARQRSERLRQAIRNSM